jgi:hypothetical protein
VAGLLQNQALPLYLHQESWISTNPHAACTRNIAFAGISVHCRPLRHALYGICSTGLLKSDWCRVLNNKTNLA